MYNREREREREGECSTCLYMAVYHNPTHPQNNIHKGNTKVANDRDNYNIMNNYVSAMNFVIVKIIDVGIVQQLWTLIHLL